MKRHSHTIEPDVERELAALEAALAGEPGADPVLAALVADARAVRPEPTDAFTARLDDRAAAGFAPEAAASGPTRGRDRAARAALDRRRRATPRRALLPALGVAASVILAVAVGVSLVGTDTARRGPAAATPPCPRRSGAAGQARSAAPQSAQESGGDALGTIEAGPPHALPGDPGLAVDRRGPRPHHPAGRAARRRCRSPSPATRSRASRRRSSP